MKDEKGYTSKLKEQKGRVPMSKQIDDYEAVRTLVETLKDFEAIDQERIIRWTKEKLGLAYSGKTPVAGLAPSSQTPTTGQPGVDIQPGKTTDIKAFVDTKNPVSDKHFIASIAYYYRFEAPENQRKDSITIKDLQDACRKVGRKRLKPQALVNTHNAGLIDNIGWGKYTINTVGENLVAMTLPIKKIESQKSKGIRKKRTIKKKNKKRGTRK